MPNQWAGILGIIVVLLLAFAASNNRRAINLKLIAVALGLQVLIAFFVLKTPVGIYVFEKLGAFIVSYIEHSANVGARFVFGFLANKEVITDKVGAPYQFIFFFNVLANLIFISLLISILYYFGIIQRIIALISRLIHKALPVSGSEAISSVSSAIVGQVEAQMMIKPYLKGMTKSELFCSMSGSLACLSGSILMIYISLGVQASYLMASSFMAVPGAIAISKIIFPETEVSETMGVVRLTPHTKDTNLLGAMATGCADGLKITLNVAAMLIGFIALITFVNLGLQAIVSGLTLGTIFSWIFYPIAWLIGIPAADVSAVSQLLGTKLVLNEFVAFMDLRELIAKHAISERSIALTSITLASFSNFSSVGIQIGGIGTLVPSRRGEIARLGMRALFCATLVAYLSAAIASLIL